MNTGAAKHLRQERAPLRYYPLLIALGGVLVTGAGWAADPSTAATTPRGKLDHLLSCQQTEKDTVLAEKSTVLKNISDLETLIRSMGDNPRFDAAHAKADLGLTRAHDALDKIEVRLALAERKTVMTVRALEYLAPESGGVTKSVPSTDAARRELNRRADVENASSSLDAEIGSTIGFVSDPVLLQRLSGLVNRLQILSTRQELPIQVRVLPGKTGVGAAASATTIYFDKSYLDEMPSESELLFVAAHELAHVQLGHFGGSLLGRERDKKQLDQDLTPVAKAAISEDAKAILLKMRTGPWEQRQEEAADLLGAQLALDAGASPKGIQEFLLRAEADRESMALTLTPDRQRYRDSLRDHPKPLDRLKSLETVLGAKFWERTDLIAGACPK